jgi:D-aminopeptidase
MHIRIIGATLAVFMGLMGTAVASDNNPRARDLGLEPGILPPGELNAITDVSGVLVGHQTLIEGESVRTGVTAVLPHDGNLFQEKVPAAVDTANGFGKAAGFEQVRELGNIESPILLTNTLSVGTAIEAGVAWTLKQPGNEDVRSVNVVAGETNDGYLNDIRGQHVTRQHVFGAINSAEGGAVTEGNAGAGTGTRALGWKGGIGTASRKLPEKLGGWTVGVLVQANFGGILTVDGIPVGERLGRHDFHDILSGEAGTADIPEDEGSVMVVIATDAPVGSRNLERMARRAPLGIARTGGYMNNGSGDFMIAFSTADRISSGDPDPVNERARLANNGMSALFLGVVEATEEAVYNALMQAEPMTGRDGHTAEALNDGSMYDVFSGANEGRDSAPYHGSAFGIDEGARAEKTTLRQNNLLAPNGAESKDEHSELTAQCNWWGAKAGPTHDDNSDGTGTWALERGATIEYTPWLIAPAPANACRGGDRSA